RRRSQKTDRPRACSSGYGTNKKGEELTKDGHRLELQLDPRWRCIGNALGHRRQIDDEAEGLVGIARLERRPRAQSGSGVGAQVFAPRLHCRNGAAKAVVKDDAR
ncbi:hypothetical protein RZS08_48290, partial [Arthrospira platensis SPKY1]|nr:hypothetical protein [Arthrospira platensis SPKY1]